MPHNPKKRRAGGGRKKKADGWRRIPLQTCLDERAARELRRRVAASGMSLPDWLSAHFMPRDPAELVVSWSR